MSSTMLKLRGFLKIPLQGIQSLFIFQDIRPLKEAAPNISSSPVNGQDAQVQAFLTLSIMQLREYGFPQCL